MAIESSWEKATLGATGMRVTRLGLGGGYGLGARDVERAVERGVNYIYWGSARHAWWAEAVRNLGPAKREELVIVIQSYTRLSKLLRGSLERALRDLRTDYADLLLLGWWNAPPPRKILDAALELKAAGKARGILISSHHRPTFEAFINDPAYDGIMVRYSAAHPGAEREVFSYLAARAERRPAVVSYTATRWGTLLRPELTPPGERTPRASDCYRFALSNPNVDVCLAGPKNGAELDEALTALERGPLSDDEMAWMRRVGAHVHKAMQGKGFGKAVSVVDKVVDLLSRASHLIER
jgi:aryl-alcohol dehydrogenase-like predicted oxidoreductase